jgi:hypothetical protein
MKQFSEKKRIKIRIEMSKVWIKYKRIKKRKELTYLLKQFK